MSNSSANTKVRNQASKFYARVASFFNSKPVPYWTEYLRDTRD